MPAAAKGDGAQELDGADRAEGEAGDRQVKDGIHEREDEA